MGLLDTDTGDDRDAYASVADSGPVVPEGDELETVPTAEMYPRTVPGYVQNNCIVISVNILHCLHHCI